MSLRIDPQIVKKIADSVAIFSGMPVDSLRRALDIAEVRQLEAGDVVFREGDIGHSFYVVIVGAVSVKKLRDGKPVVLTTLGVGECFGEMTLVRDASRTATVEAETDCVTLCFERDLIDANPRIAHIIYKNIAAVLAQRLDERTATLADMLGQRMP